MKLEINVPVSGLDLASLMTVPLPKPRTKLHHCGKSRSFDRLRANAHWQTHPGAGGTHRGAGTLVRDQNQQLN